MVGENSQQRGPHLGCELSVCSCQIHSLHVSQEILESVHIQIGECVVSGACDYVQTSKRDSKVGIVSVLTDAVFLRESSFLVEEILEMELVIKPRIADFT